MVEDRNCFVTDYAQEYEELDEKFQKRLNGEVDGDWESLPLK